VKEREESEKKSASFFSVLNVGVSNKTYPSKKRTVINCAKLSTTHVAAVTIPQKRIRAPRYLE
jgi:hypothetical protein